MEEYANNIAEFVEENLQSLGEINEEGLQRLVVALNKFYKSKSLFNRNTGKPSQYCQSRRT